MAAATTIVNAKVFDGTKSRDWTSVRFADGLITECSPVSAAREGDEVIDAAGGTVLPGLIDAHVHLVPGTWRLVLINLPRGGHAKLCHYPAFPSAGDSGDDDLVTASACPRVTVTTGHRWRHGRRRSSPVIVVDPGSAVDRGCWVGAPK